MSCEPARGLIDAYVDGELDLAGSLEIERHLAACEACTRVYQSRRLLGASMREESLYRRSPDALRQRVQRAVRSASPGRPRWHWVAIAASLVCVALFSWNWSRRASGEELLAQEIVSSHVRSLMANHLTDVTSTDQHTVKPWFAGKLNFSPPVEDPEGFPLIGGRLDYVGKRPVAALVYQRRKHVINLLISSAPGSPDAPRSSSELEGYNVVRWIKSGMSYWAVSDVSRADLMELAAKLGGR